MGKTFSVVEYSTHYTIRNNKNGVERGIGDGIDTIFDEDGEAYSPGTKEFLEKLEDSLNSNDNEVMEAYFPEFLENKNLKFE